MIKNSITQCRFYCGEDECPFQDRDPRSTAWKIERLWIKAPGPHDVNTTRRWLEEYSLHGLDDFHKDDAVPIQLKAFLMNRFFQYNDREDIELFKRFYEETYGRLVTVKERDIFFNKDAHEIWAMARLHHTILRGIQDSPYWEKEDIPDIPLTEEQMVSFVKGYFPTWEWRYAPYMLGGWFYITRSGYWLKKFNYQKGNDGFYHIVDHYTTLKEKGRNLLAQVIIEGLFDPRIYDERLQKLFIKIDSIKCCHYYKGEKQNPFDGVDQNKAMLWLYEECFATGGVKNDLPEYISDYKSVGLCSFAENDGVPIGLKALIFNRYAKGWQSTRSAAESFKEFYQRYYGDTNQS